MDDRVRRPAGRAGIEPCHRRVAETEIPGSVNDSRSSPTLAPRPTPELAPLTPAPSGNRAHE